MTTGSKYLLEILQSRADGTVAEISLGRFYPVEPGNCLKGSAENPYTLAIQPIRALILPTVRFGGKLP